LYSGCKGRRSRSAIALAREVVAHNVTINTICPGPTDHARRWKRVRRHRATKARRSATRWCGGVRAPAASGCPTTSGLVAFLAIDDAAFMTARRQRPRAVSPCHG